MSSIPTETAYYKIFTGKSGALLSNTRDGNTYYPMFNYMTIMGENIILVGFEPQNRAINFGTIARFNYTTGSIDKYITFNYGYFDFGSDSLSSIGFGFLRFALVPYIPPMKIEPNGIIPLDDGRFLLSTTIYDVFIPPGGVALVDLNNLTVQDTIFFNNTFSTVTGIHQAPDGNILVTGAAKGTAMISFLDPSNMTVFSSMLIDIEVNPDPNTGSNYKTLSIVDDAYYDMTGQLYVAGRYFTYNTSKAIVVDKGIFILELNPSNTNEVITSSSILSIPLTDSDPYLCRSVINIEPGPEPGQVAFAVEANTTTIVYSIPVPPYYIYENLSSTLLGILNIQNNALLAAKSINPNDTVSYIPMQFEKRTDGSYLLLTWGQDYYYWYPHTVLNIIDPSFNYIETSLSLNNTLISQVIINNMIDIALSTEGLFPGPSAWPYLVGYNYENLTGQMIMSDYPKIDEIIPRQANISVTVNPDLDIVKLPTSTAYVMDNLPNASISSVDLRADFQIYNNNPNGVTLSSQIDNFTIEEICKLAADNPMPVVGPSSTLYGYLVCPYNTLIFTNVTISNVTVGEYEVIFDVSNKTLITLLPPPDLTIKSIKFNNITLCDGDCYKFYNKSSGLYEFDPSGTIIITFSTGPAVSGVLIDSHNYDDRSLTNSISPMFLLLGATLIITLIILTKSKR
ncbi:MAG: hypothetical protein GSR77_00720 [Desulfurococcales archaeon]|nr:hypothetical protein [Desulfurococcales archaeon]